MHSCALGAFHFLGGSPSGGEVAQIFNLLYRRLVVGRPHAKSDAPGDSDTRRIENPRYSRLTICATTLARSINLTRTHAPSLALRPHRIPVRCAKPRHQRRLHEAASIQRNPL